MINSSILSVLLAASFLGGRPDRRRRGLHYWFGDRQPVAWSDRMIAKSVAVTVALVLVASAALAARWGI
jgi:hypothetical protein